MLTIDGAYGEGGGQILRSACALAAITGKPLKLVNIRAGRSKPGLRPQHLTSVRAAARICNARLEGAQLGSQTLLFEPHSASQAGNYTFDVLDAAQGGSAGSVMLVFQTVFLPLALAAGESRLCLKGGTHVNWSPSALYVEQVFLPTLAKMGVQADLHVEKWGFYPRGGGQVTVEIKGNATLAPCRSVERGDLQEITGTAYAGQLPSHIPQRMADRVQNLLRKFNVPVRVEPRHVTSGGPGAGLFLLARYENAVAGFTSLGRQGLPAEQVAQVAVDDLLAHHHTAAPVDAHLGDQLVLPFVLAEGESHARVARITQHLLTNVWLARQFTSRQITVTGELGEPGMLVCEPPEAGVG
ncbi:MAG: RNA 3'-phosphate cyclase [Anaerolineae bacterium]|nr:RNA 3'-phosphate cyclase [Anaerolineae bacterium]